MRPNNQNDLDEFKRALTMAMRSISKEDELTVSFGAETGSCLLYTSPSPRDPE